MELPDFVRLCNCASCHRELLGWSMRAWYETLPMINKRSIPPFVEEKIAGRPYCKWCLTEFGPAEVEEGVA